MYLETNENAKIFRMQQKQYCEGSMAVQDNLKQQEERLEQSSLIPEGTRKKQNKPKISGKRKVLKIRAEINEETNQNK